MYFNATLANPASSACLLYYNLATNQINLLNDNADGVAGGDPGSSGDAREQPVLAQCGG